MSEISPTSALADLAREALATADAPHAELFLRDQRRAVARFSRNLLDQHGEHHEPTAIARVALPADGGWRLAEATTTILTRDALVRAVGLAREAAALAPVSPDFQGFAPPSEEVDGPPRTARATEDWSADARADQVAAILAHARAHRVTAAGLLETTATSVAYANTRGLLRRASATLATCKVFALDADGTSGFAQSTHRDVTHLDAAALAREAVGHCLAGRDPIVVEPGVWDVLLEPPAVVEILEWLGFMAFGARAVLEHTSPLAGRFGQCVTGASVTLVDDATDPADDAFGLPFDREGTLRRRVVLLEDGVARGCVSDRTEAHRLGAVSTGHAGNVGEALGPTVSSLAMAGGDGTRASLLARMDRGLHIHRFHYVNGFLDTRNALMTGMTRDGTFLVERGERVRGVKNLRFTDRMLEAFARIDGLTRDRAAVPTWWNDAGAFVAPAVLLRGLRFTGGSSR